MNKKIGVEAAINAVRERRHLMIDKYPTIKQHYQGAFSCDCCKGRGLLKSLKPIEYVNAAGDVVLTYHDVRLCPDCFGEGVTFRDYLAWENSHSGQEWKKFQSISEALKNPAAGLLRASVPA